MKDASKKYDASCIAKLMQPGLNKNQSSDRKEGEV